MFLARGLSVNRDLDCQPCSPSDLKAHSAGQELQTLASGGELEGFMQTFAVLVDGKTGAMRGVNPASACRTQLSLRSSPSDTGRILYLTKELPGHRDSQCSRLAQDCCRLTLALAVWPSDPDSNPDFLSSGALSL